jgi:hypothetical protein
MREEELWQEVWQELVGWIECAIECAQCAGVARDQIASTAIFSLSLIPGCS